VHVGDAVAGLELANPSAVLANPLAADQVLALRGERRLVIGAQIGRGSLGVVFAARIEQTIHARPGRTDTMATPAAVKVIVPVFGRDPEAMAAVRKAVRCGALVRHPNVVEVNDFFVMNDVPCIVSELVWGMSLQSLLARYAAAKRRVPLDLALFVACEIAEGLCAARSARNLDGAMLNMAHHDLSPRQVLLGFSGEVKVKGFGMRVGGGVSSGVRRADTDVRRQISFMAPEVACGGRGDGRSDVFSLGVLMHEMLRGPRFRHDTSARDMLDFARHGVVHRSVTEPLLPSGVGAVLDRALEVDPRARYPHAGVLAYDLRREAFALGVGDGRAFLRTVLFEMSEGLGEPHDTERGSVPDV